MVKTPFLMNLTTDELIEKPDIAADIFSFLWIVSPQFKPGAKRKRNRFIEKNRRVLKMKASKVIDEIKEYLNEAFLDSTDGPDGERSFYSTAAALTGFFNKNYGIKIDSWENGWLRNFVRKLTGDVNVLDIPLRIAFQLVKVHQRSQNPDILFLNRLSQPKIDEHFSRLNQANKN